MRFAEPFEISAHKLTVLYNGALYKEMMNLVQEQLDELDFKATIIEGGSGKEDRKGVCSL